MPIELINVLLLLLVGSIAAGCTQSLPHLHHPPSPTLTPMSFTTDVIVKQITLQVREEKFSPDGAAPKADRDVGFADVFLSVENLKQEQVNIVVKQIQILDAATNRVQLTTHHPIKVQLHSLESSVNDFHLTNKTGFKGVKTLKAVVIYQVGDRTQTVESEVVAAE